MIRRRVLWAIVYVLIGAAAVGGWALMFGFIGLGDPWTFLWGGFCGALYAAAGFQHWRRAEEREIAGAVE